MICTVAVARFIWTPLLWLSVLLLSFCVVAVLCNIFDSNGANEAMSRDNSSADENEIVKDEVAMFARKYLKGWMGNRYKYILLPIVLLLAFLALLLVG